MATLNNTRNWYDDPASQPYHADLDIAAANSQQAAIASGHPENALSARQIAQQIGIESGYNTGAVSKKGAVGIAQIMPSTAQDPGYGIGPVDPTDPHAAIQWAGSYDGARGVTGYSNGGYGVSDLVVAPANGSKTVTNSGGMSEQEKNAIANAPDGTGMIVLNKDGTTTYTPYTPGTFEGAANWFLYGNKNGKDAALQDMKNSGLTGAVAAGEEIFTRIVVVGIGLLLIFGGLIMFRPVQNAINTVKP